LSQSYQSNEIQQSSPALGSLACMVGRVTGADMSGKKPPPNTPRGEAKGFGKLHIVVGMRGLGLGPLLLMIPKWPLEREPYSIKTRGEEDAAPE